MKHIITLLVLAISLTGFAQKMKVKKDQITVDKQPVANFTKEKGLFTLSNLDNTNATTITIEHCVISNKFYLQFTDVATQVGNQKPLTSYSAMNETKYVLLALEDAGFITPEGIQTNALNDFINGEKFDLAKEYGCSLITEGKEKLAAMNIQVQSNGAITKGTNTDMGRITRSISLDVIKYEDHTYKFYNATKELVATAQGKMTSSSVMGTLTTFDNKTFKIPMEKFFSSTYDAKRDDNIEMILIILLQNGYNL